MKTLDEVIKALELCSTDDNPCDKCPYTAFDKNGVWACSMCGDFAEDALHYLRGYREVLPEYAQMKLDAVKNDPLTWDELRQMKGKPVWIWLPPKIKNTPGSGRWEIIYKFNPVGGNKNLFEMETEDGGLFLRKNQGKIWNAYRKERK